MILEEATKEAFGYDPNMLKPYSKKRILVACEICGEFRPLRRGDYRTFCNSCSTILGEKLKGENNPNFDKHPTEGTRALLSTARNGKKNPNWQSGPTKCVCLKCGKGFYVKECEIRRGRGKCCSNKCANEVKKGKVNLAAGRDMNGKNNPRWLDGISFEPYCIKFNESYKRKIRERFGNECFLCAKTEQDNGKALCVHHVNYNKNCGCDETKCICVPLCMRCHTKTNADRDYWQALIMEMLQPLEAWV